MSTRHESTPEILIHMRLADTPTLAGAVGLAIARRLDAWAIGLHVIPIAMTPIAAPEAIAMYSIDSDASYRAALDCEPQWRAQLDAHAVRGEWQVAQGDAVESLCHASRWCDLVVVERAQLNPEAPVGWDVASRTVFSASTPVVVVPETARGATPGSRIVISWNQSREAALAIRGALPLLQRAELVAVFEVDHGESPFGLRWVPKLDLRAWLRRHGVDATFKSLATQKEPGSALLDNARTLDADLIVMGAWGHSRISELVLGGTTRHMLQHSELPLLLAH